jgi:PAS domain S-box-containing protein
MAIDLTAIESRELLDSLSDAIVMTDSEGRIVSVNVQVSEMLGYSDEELLGQPVEILVPEALRERHVHHRNAFLQNPSLRPMNAMELQARRKDGTLFSVEISLAAVSTPQGVRVISAIRPRIMEARLRNWRTAADIEERRAQWTLKTSPDSRKGWTVWKGSSRKRGVEQFCF